MYIYVAPGHVFHGVLYEEVQFVPFAPSFRAKKSRDEHRST